MRISGILSLSLSLVLVACSSDPIPVVDESTTSGSSDGSTSSSQSVVDSSLDGATSTGAPTSSTGGPTATSSDESSGEPTGVTGCVDNSDCAADEVCAQSVCVDAWAVPIAVDVISFNEPCDGAGTNQFFVTAVGMDSSTTTCPITWVGDYFTVGAGGSGVEFEFYEVGGSADDRLITTWCWDMGLGCGPIPKSVLHQGFVEETWRSWTASFNFTPIGA